MKILASHYAIRVFGDMADTLLAYEKEHPELTRKECMDALWGNSEWSKNKVIPQVN